MNKNQEFIPINLKSVKDKVVQKKAEKEQDEEAYGKSTPESNLLKSQEIGGVIVHTYSNYNVPFFLEDVKEVELNFLDDSGFDPSDEDDANSEKWKKAEFAESFKKALDKVIQESDNKPFQIGFSYRTRDILIKLGLIPESFKNYSKKVFYLPTDYEADIKRFNEHVFSKSKKDGEEKLANMIGNISLN